MLSIKYLLVAIALVLATSLLTVNGSRSFRDSIPVIGAEELGGDDALFNDLHTAAAMAGDEVFHMPSQPSQSVRVAGVTSNQIEIGKMELETFSGFSSEVCECHDHTETCDSVTGICSDCTGYTTGNHCELCLPGYSGDATAGDCADTTAPVLSCPENKKRTATSASGVAVSWTVPTATDSTGGSVELTADHTNNATYPIGTTVVTYTATDLAGNTAKCSFNITVVDTIAFSTGCPSDISLTTSSPSGQATTWTKPVATSASGTQSVSCTSTSNSTYPIGTTTITCTATTSSGETKTCSFHVVVALVTTSNPRAFTWTGAPSSMTVYRSVDTRVFVSTTLAVTDTGAGSDATVIVTAIMSPGDVQSGDYGVLLTATVDGVTTVPAVPTTGSATLKLTGSLTQVNAALKKLAYYVHSGSYASITLIVADYTNTSISTSVSFPITIQCSGGQAAPTVSSARLSSTGATIVITFSGTFVSNATGTDCSQWFQSTSLLGTGATCVVTSTTVLTVTLGSSATVAVGSTLTFVSNIIRTCTASNLYLTGSATVLAPTSAATPTVSISGSSSVISCSGVSFTLSSTAGGASRFTYSWSLPEGVTGVTTTSSSIVVPVSQLSSGSSYTFSVTVTSWLGTSATASKTVSVTNELVPILTVSGDTTRTLSSTVSNQLSVTATAPACLSAADAALGTVFSWSVSPSNTALATALSSSTRTVTIPANAMAASTTYVFTLSAHFVANSKNSSSATITVTTSAIPVVARISNGDRAVGRSSTVTLSGSKSTAGTGVNITFAWSCATSSGNACTLLDNSGVLSLTTSSTGGTSFSAAVLSAGAYVFTLTATGSDGQSSTASVTITILAGSAPQLGLTSSAPSSGVIASSSPLRLSSVLIQADTAVTYSWSETSGHGLDLSSYTSRSLYLNSAGTNGYWIQGATYTFRVYATLVGTTTSGYADVSVTINQSPVGGTLTSDLASSESMVDTVTLSTSGWADANGDSISYQFFYISTSGSRVLLGSKGSDSFKSGVTLPPGNSSNSYQLTVGVRATDAYGAYNDATTTIISTSPDVLTSGNSTALSSFFEAQVAAAMATGDTEAIYSAATIVASTLSTSCNPDLANTLAASLVSGASTAPLDQGIAALTAISNPACSLGSSTASNVLSVLGPLASRVDASDPVQLTNVFGTVGQLYEGMADLSNEARGALLVSADNVMRSLATSIVSDSGALQSAGDAYEITVGSIQTSLLLVDPTASEVGYSVDDDTDVTVPSGVVSGDDNVVLRVYVQPRPTETTGSSSLGASRLTIEVATSTGSVYTSFGSSSSSSGRRLLSSSTGMNVTMAYNATILSSCGSTKCTPICVAWNSTDNTWTSSSSIVVTISASNGVAICQLYQSATLSVTSTAVVDSTSTGNGGGNYEPDYSYSDDLDERNKKLYIAGAVLIGCGILLGAFCWYRAGKKRSSSKGPTAEMTSFVAASPAHDDYGLAAHHPTSATGAPIPSGPVHLVVVSNDDVATRFQAANPPPQHAAAGGVGSRGLDNFGSDGADDYQLPARSPSNGDDSDSSSGYRPVRSPMGPDAGSVALRNPVMLHD